MVIKRHLARSNFPHHVEAAYTRLLLTRVDAFHQLVAGEVLDVLRQRTDVDERSRRDSKRDDEREARAAIRRAGNQAKDHNPIQYDALTLLASRVDHHIRKQVSRQLANVPGFERLEFSEVEQERLQQAAARGAALIRSLDGRYLEDVQEVVIEGIQSGATIDAIKASLQERADVSASRAKLIAADQVATIGREMVQARHEELGITEYEWATAGDKRVRPACKANNGKTFEWSEGDGGEHPGDRIRCRCQATPVIPQSFGELRESMSEQGIEPVRLQLARFVYVSDQRIDEIMERFRQPLPIDQEWNRRGYIPQVEDFAAVLAEGTPRTQYGARLLEVDVNGDVLADIQQMPQPAFEGFIRANFGDDPRNILGVTDGFDIILPSSNNHRAFTVVHEISHLIDNLLHDEAHAVEFYEDVVVAYQQLQADDPEQAAKARDRMAERAFVRLVEEEERAFRTQNDYLLTVGEDPAYQRAPELREAIRAVYIDLWEPLIMRDFYGR